MDPLKAQKIVDAIAGIAVVVVWEHEDGGHLTETLEARKTKLIKLLMEK